MDKKQIKNVLKLRILELDYKLMDLIELSIKYENSSVPVFELEMIEFLKEIE